MYVYVTFLHVYIVMDVCAASCANVCTCMWRIKVDVESLPQSLCTLLSGQGFLLNLKTGDSARLSLVSLAQGFHVSASGIWNPMSTLLLWGSKF